MMSLFLSALLLARYGWAACPDGSALKTTTFNKDTNGWAHWIGSSDAFNAADMSFDMPASNAQIDIKKVIEANTAIRKNELAFHPVADPTLKLTTSFKLQCEGEGQGTVAAMIGFTGKDYNWLFQLAYAQDRFTITVYATDGPDWHQGLNGKFEDGLSNDGKDLDTFYHVDDTVVKDSVCGHSGYSFQVIVTDVSFILQRAKIGEPMIKMVEYTPKEVLVPSSKEGGLQAAVGGYWMTPDDTKRLVSYSEVKIEGCQIGATAETAEPLESQPDQREAVNEPDEAPTTQQDQQPEATTVDLPKPPGAALADDASTDSGDAGPSAVLQTSSSLVTSAITSSVPPKPTPVDGQAEQANKGQNVLTVYNTIDVPAAGSSDRFTSQLARIGFVVLLLCLV